MKRIVITGPESSGKSTLARYLAAEFNTVYVPEYARVYLEDKGQEYRESDLVNIAAGQLALLESIEAAATGKQLIFLDTWMLTLRIWSLYRFGSVPDLIEHMYATHQPELYLLCTPDLAWEPDPLRENPDDRDALFEMYRRHIVASAIPFITVSGTDAAREQRVVQLLQNFILNSD